MKRLLSADENGSPLQKMLSLSLKRLYRSYRSDSAPLTSEEVYEL